MDLKFTQNGIIEQENASSDYGQVTFISKAAGVKEESFANVVQIIDESGNEVNCTIDKFIEIFDNHGLEGFIM